jgi:predicted methyltransferase
MKPTQLLCFLLCTTLLVAGCTTTSNAPNGTTNRTALISTAVADSRRPAADIARDAGRKPEAVLEFSGVAPGMAILDMFAGGGYYTELAASVVGPQGRVIAYNNTGYAAIAGKDMASRLADDRFGNVEYLVSANNELELPTGTFDVVMFVLSYHDVYYLDGERGWAKIDRPRMLREVFEAVKPGGHAIVIDHVATAGLPAEQVRALHRIDPSLVRADFEAAGFRYDGESNVLRNPDDDFNVVAMAPHVRGKTDRALLRFLKP